MESYVPPKKLVKEEVEGLEDVIFDHITGYRQYLEDLANNKVRICVPVAELESDDEHSGVEMEYDC